MAGATGNVNGGIINMHISIKGGMAANQVGVESISGVWMVRRAHNEGHKGIEHSFFLLFVKVRVKLFMNMVDKTSKGRPCGRRNRDGV